jgi:hypothetical protein
MESYGAPEGAPFQNYASSIPSFGTTVRGEEECNYQDEPTRHQSK